jgi:hypothetical protein
MTGGWFPVEGVEQPIEVGDHVVGVLRPRRNETVTGRNNCPKGNNCPKEGIGAGGNGSAMASGWPDIVLRATVDQLTLCYRVRKHEGDWQDVEQPTQILWVTCRFGGRRPYFLCAGWGCGRLVSKLYGAGTCRLAYGYHPR